MAPLTYLCASKHINLHANGLLTYLSYLDMLQIGCNEVPDLTMYNFILNAKLHVYNSHTEFVLCYMESGLFPQL